MTLHEIAQGLDITVDQARDIREAARSTSKQTSPQRIDEALELANKYTGAHGIEAIRGKEWGNHYYGDIVALYVNMGDSYSTTLLFDCVRAKWHVTGYADWVEKNDRRLGIK